MTATPTPATPLATPTPATTTADALADVADAFSRAAARYDALAFDNPHLARMRSKVYAHVERAVPAGAHILELNAGTGIDALELVRRGYTVHATDIAPDMLARARAKADRSGLGGRFTVEARSFADLGSLPAASFDAVFSNFGGLNCASDLGPVVAGVRHALRPGGTVVWVVMPPICPWELAQVVRGDLRTATRRLRRGPVRAHLEGRWFDVRYHTPGAVARAFGDGFEVLEIEAISVLTPTANSRNLARRHPRAYGALAWPDDRVSRLPLVRGWGDFFAISLRRSR